MGTGRVPLIMFSGMLHQKIIIISASSFPESSSLLPRLIEICEMDLLCPTPPPHHVFSRHMCTAAAQSFRVSLTVKTCLILFLITDSILLHGFGSHSHLRSSHAFGLNAILFMHFDFKGDPHRQH